MAQKLKAAFCYFGAKSRVSDEVWRRFGKVSTYIEPFAGSAAVLLAAPRIAKLEIVNDMDCMVSNFYRSLKAAPDKVAEYCDYPINHCDLISRHRWLMQQKDFRHKMLTDPDYYDPKIAGWWVWGINIWIGDGWCAEKKDKSHTEWRQGLSFKGTHKAELTKDLPVVGMKRENSSKIPYLGSNGKGINRGEVVSQRPHLKGQGTMRKDLTSSQVRYLGAGGKGTNRDLSQDPIPHLGESREGTHRRSITNLEAYLEALANRFRNVRVCCGDWSRVCTDFVLGEGGGPTAIFLDPPYAAEAGRDNNIYAVDSLTVAHEVREWAIKKGEDRKLRIALCGYEGEHELPKSWSVFAWTAQGGYGVQSNGRGRTNRKKERIWFSPGCNNAGFESWI